MIDTTFRSHGDCQTLKAGIMVKVVRYCRVSTEEQSETGHAMAAKHEKLKAYAALDDLELIEITEDGGQSVKTLNRPGLQRALQLLRNGEADGPPDAKSFLRGLAGDAIKATLAAAGSNRLKLRHASAHALIFLAPICVFRTRCGETEQPQAGHGAANLRQKNSAEIRAPLEMTSSQIFENRLATFSGTTND